MTEASLSAVVPLLNTAFEALDRLTKADIIEIKGMRHPHVGKHQQWIPIVQLGFSWGFS